MQDIGRFLLLFDIICRVWRLGVSDRRGLLDGYKKEPARGSFLSAYFDASVYILAISSFPRTLNAPSVRLPQ